MPDNPAISASSAVAPAPPGHAQHEWVCQRVAQQCLQQRAGQRQQAPTANAVSARGRRRPSTTSRAIEGSVDQKASQTAAGASCTLPSINDSNSRATLAAPTVVNAGMRGNLDKRPPAMREG